MKKWQDLAPPDDPDSFYDIDGFWPTSRGSYETADFLTSTTLTATATPSATAPVYAYGAMDVAGDTLEYVIAGGGIWQNITSGTGLLSNVAGAASVIAGVTAAQIQMVQFGDVTILASDTQGSFKKAVNDSSFATLSALLQCPIVCVQSNVVLGFRIHASQDKWITSDVGDYTNYSTGEAANGHIYQRAGPITAAVPFGNDVIVFKAGSIYRMTYVGGVIKWAVNLIWVGAGCGTLRGACAGSAGILYCGVTVSDPGSPTTPWYYFDGVNPPTLVNPLTTIPASSSIIWNPIKEIFTVWVTGVPYYFSPKTMQWGKSANAIGDASFVPLEGDFTSHIDLSSTTSGYSTGGATSFKRWAPGGGATGKAGTCYVQTAKLGDAAVKSTFERVTPITRRKVDLGSGTTALVAQTYRERWDNSVQASANATISTYRDRYDLSGLSGMSDNYARFKHTWTNFDVEVDDLKVDQVPAGTG